MSQFIIKIIREKMTILLALSWTLQLIIIVPEKCICDSSHVNTISLYILDSVSFLTDKIELRATISPEGCDSKDERVIHLNPFYDRWDHNPKPRDEHYNLTLIDCYNFTLSYKRKNISLHTYPPINFERSCDMSQFRFSLVGVSNIRYYRPYGPVSTDEGRRCNFVRRNKTYPLDDKVLQSMKYSPISYIMYVVLGVIVIGAIWLMCFIFGYKLVKPERTSIVIRSRSDVCLTSLKEEETDNHRNSADSQSPIPFIATTTNGHAPSTSSLPPSGYHFNRPNATEHVAEVELHHKGDEPGLRKGQGHDAPSAPEYPPLSNYGHTYAPSPMAPPNYKDDNYENMLSHDATNPDT